MFPQRCSAHFRTIGRLAAALSWLGCCCAAGAQDRAIPLEAGATYRAAALPERSEDHFRLAIDKVGLLTVDLSAPHLLTTEPELEEVAARPGSGVYWVSAAQVVEIGVRSAAPGQPLGAYRLRTAFVARSAPEMAEIAMAGDPPYSCAMVPASLGDPWSGSQGVVVSEAVDEWDCDVLEGQTLAPGVLRLESRLGSLRALLFGGDVCGGETFLGMGFLAAAGQVLAPLFPGPFRIAVDAAGGFTGAYRLAAALLDPCHQGEQDDHHDSWLCATSLPPATAVAGTIGNGHGDDVDQFTFRLEQPATVTLDLDSAADGFRLRIADATGQPIEAFAGPHSWQATLGAGRYFLGVDRPAGGSAAYEVSWTAAP